MQTYVNLLSSCHLKCYVDAHDKIYRFARSSLANLKRVDSKRWAEPRALTQHWTEPEFTSLLYCSRKTPRSFVYNVCRARTSLRQHHSADVLAWWRHTPLLRSSSQKRVERWLLRVASESNLLRGVFCLIFLRHIVERLGKSGSRLKRTHLRWVETSRLFVCEASSACLTGFRPPAWTTTKIQGCV